MIESSSQFWTFIMLFAAGGGVILGFVWRVIFRRRKK